MSIGGRRSSRPLESLQKDQILYFCCLQFFSYSLLSNVILYNTKLIFHNLLALVIIARLNRVMKRNTSRICKSCTEEFNPARPWQQYCSRKCQIRDGGSPECGAIVASLPLSRTNQAILQQPLGFELTVPACLDSNQASATDPRSPELQPIRRWQ